MIFKVMFLTLVHHMIKLQSNKNLIYVIKARFDTALYFIVSVILYAMF